MSKISLLIYTLLILTPIILIFITYKLSGLRDYNRIQKKNLLRLMYLISIVLLILNAGIYISDQQAKNQSLDEISRINERFDILQAENKQLQNKSLNQSNDQQELTKENQIISDHNNGLSSRIQELKKMVSQKDLEIAELENQLKIHGLSAEQIELK